MTWLLVALGGAAGAPARYLLDAALTVRRPGSFPIGTLVINVLGAALLGALAATMNRTGLAYAAAGTGFCGAFTTFSTFSWETFALAEDGLPVTAVLNVGASLLLGLGAASATYWLC
jgi:CrcB protein